MRLKKLTMQAFGPFKDKIIIDFENSKIDKGLLLIYGDTGAGKTTIFDAICYALYGQTSSGEKERSANSLRSDWASSDVDTFTELEFYYKNKLYNVKRSTEYNRKKKNGVGETKQPPTAEININGVNIVKVNEVTNAIEKLIGLDYKQFRQVAMLSQGEFTKFLLASSSEKTTIFRKIFGTEFYDLFQIKLKEDEKAKKDDLEKLKDKIDTEKKNIEPIINLFGLSNDETLNFLNNKIQEENDVVLEIKKKRDKKNEEITKLSNQLININKLNKDILRYQTACEDLDQLLLNNPNIDLEREKYDYNIKVASFIANTLYGLEKDSKSLEDKKKQANNNQKELILKQKEYKEKEQLYKKLDNYFIDVEFLNNEINELSNKNKDYDNYLNSLNELKKIEKIYKNNSELYNKQNKLYEKMRKEYYLNISVELADTLIDGEECPVCGSKDHPRKAVSSKCNYTKEELKKAENELKNLDSLRKENEASIDQIRKIMKQYNISNNIDISNEKNKIKELLISKKKIKEDYENEFKRISSDKEKIKSNIKSLLDGYKIINDDILKLEENINNYNIKLADFYKNNNTSYEEYNRKKLDKEALSELKFKIEDFDNKRKKLEMTIKLLEENVKSKKIVPIDELENELNMFSSEYQKLDDKYTELNVSLGKLTLSASNINNYLNDSKVIQNEYNTIKILSDTANGLLVGHQKITFENYVQSYYMQSVLIEANKRLLKMSDNRYELKKKETDIKNSGKTGLDFSIFDSYTGKERDVTSLSGGEKFKASLALALGLSDTISNSRGGIKIDSLFIDEGFGSLDSESLNQALNILTDLSENDKLVGVISHVFELISRIDNKILVNKTNTGSIVNILEN